MPPDRKFPPTLAALMGEMSAAELGRRAGLSGDVIANYLRGAREPSLTSFRMLCRGLGIEPGEFIARLGPLARVRYEPGSTRPRGRPKGTGKKKADK